MTTDDETGEMTIDELARASDVVVSTVRLYQNKGLLPPPVKRGRVGYYDSRHSGRLRLISQLQDRGFSLASIKEVLDGMDKGESLRAVLGLSDQTSTWAVEQQVSMSFAELAGHLPQVEFTPEMVQRVVALGLVELTSDATQVIVHSPSFLEIGSQLAALGIPTEVILDQYDILRTESHRIATRYTELFRTHLWEPFVERGMPADQVAELVGALEKLGPLAEAVVQMVLRHSLQMAAETFIEAEARRLDLDIPRPGLMHPAAQGSAAGGSP